LKRKEDINVSFDETLIRVPGTEGSQLART